MQRDHSIFLKVSFWSLGVATLLGIFAVLVADFAVVGRVAGTAVLTAVVSAVLWRMVDQSESHIHQFQTEIAWASCGSFYLLSLLAIWVPDLAGRFWGTAALAGVSGLVMWRLNESFRDHPNEFHPYLIRFGNGSFFLFGLLGIWMSPNELQGKLWGTALVMLFGSVVSATGWAATLQPERRMAGLLALVLSVCSSLIWLTGLWILSESLLSEMIMMGFALLAWGTGASICLVGWKKADPHPWRWLGVSASVVGLILTWTFIFQTRPHEFFFKLTFLCASVVVVVIHALLTLILPLKDWQISLRKVTILALIFTAATVNILVFLGIDGDNFLVRVTIASALIASFGTVTMAFIGQQALRKEKGGVTSSIFNFFKSPISQSAPPQALPKSKESELPWVTDVSGIAETASKKAVFEDVLLFCPGCQHRQRVPTGHATCSDCGLHFEISAYYVNQ